MAIGVLQECCHGNMMPNIVLFAQDAGFSEKNSTSRKLLIGFSPWYW
jgi:hypothetical protein